MKNSNITLIIINYNGWEDTIECLKSLDESLYSKAYNMSLILIDNKSPNDSIKNLIPFMREKYGGDFIFANCEEEALAHKVVLYASNENYGFSGGNNIGISIAQKRQANYVLLLNNDTIVEGDFALPLLNLMETDGQLGMVGPKQVDYYNHSNYSLGGRYNKYKGSGYAFYNTDKANGQYVSFLSGCCWLLRMDAIEKSGMMDEAYFLYIEDVDYCCTFIDNGYKLSCTKDSIVYHKENRSTPLTANLYYYNTRNRLYLCNKQKYNFLIKLVFYVYFSITRIKYYISMPELRPYLRKALYDYKMNHYGKLEM